MTFPLYTTLIVNIPEKDLTLIQKNDFIKKISNLDIDAQELIYALIKSYYLQNEKDKEIPLILTNNDIHFNLLDFPNKLRQLLYKFVNIHNKKITEDEQKK